MIKLLVVFQISTLGSLALAEDLNAVWSKYEEQQAQLFSKMENDQNERWQDYTSRLEKLWGKIEKPSAKELVEYSKDSHTRISINYETGAVTVEALAEIKADQSSIQKMAKNSVSAVISSQKELDSPIKEEELDTKGKSVEKYLSEVFSHPLAPRSQVGGDRKVRKLVTFRFDLVPDLVQKRAKAIFPLVKKWSTKHNLDPAFVLAVIRQESAFNPRARSWVPAYGLMQIVPKYAGQEVIQEVYGESYLPDSDMLFDPEKNIMMGTTYLMLLRDKYFKEVRDPVVNQYLTTCGYNWGPHRIITAVSRGRLSLKGNSEKIFSNLVSITPAETKDYLIKVSKYHLEFRKLIQRGELA